jgi:hypothetical protein
MLPQVQIALGVMVTALGVSNTNTKATLSTFGKARAAILAVLTVSTCILAFLEGREQPNRARQLWNHSRRVLDYVPHIQCTFSELASSLRLEEALKEIRRLHELAQSNAETNYEYHDTWATVGAPRKDIEKGDETDR